MTIIDRAERKERGKKRGGESRKEEGQDRVTLCIKYYSHPNLAPQGYEMVDVAHDVMLGDTWEDSAETLENWLATLK